jgi:hypothetical protein
MATASTLLATCYIHDACMSTQANQWPARCPATSSIQAPIQYKFIKKTFLVDILLLCSVCLRKAYY